MNTSHISANNVWRGCSSEGLDIDSGIPSDSNDATKKLNRSRSIAVFATCLFFAVPACVFSNSFSKSGWNLRLFTASSANHLATGEHYMDCGTAPLCGVLTLETGYGKGYYNRKNVQCCSVVLWFLLYPFNRQSLKKILKLFLGFFLFESLQTKSQACMVFGLKLVTTVPVNVYLQNLLLTQL